MHRAATGNEEPICVATHCDQRKKPSPEGTERGRTKSGKQEKNSVVTTLRGIQWRVVGISTLFDVILVPL